MERIIQRLGKTIDDITDEERKLLPMDVLAKLQKNTPDMQRVRKKDPATIHPCLKPDENTYIETFRKHSNTVLEYDKKIQDINSKKAKPSTITPSEQNAARMAFNWLRESPLIYRDKAIPDNIRPWMIELFRADTDTPDTSKS